MKIIYYDFYTDDFILFMPSGGKIVEIGIRKPRIKSKTSNPKYVPYIMTVFPEGQLDGPHPFRFRAIPMHASDRVTAEITIEGGVPKVGHQRSVCYDTRPISDCRAWSDVATMSFIGKLSLPNYSDLSDVDEKARELMKANATHLLYYETIMDSHSSSTSSALGGGAADITTEIDDTNLPRAF